MKKPKQKKRLMTSFTQPKKSIKYINRPISVNFLQRSLKLGRVIVLQAPHLLQ